MEPGDHFSEVKYAMNTRMFLMIAGAVLIFNAVTSTFPYGMRWFEVARMVTEYVEENPDGTAPTGEVLSDAAVLSDSEAAAAAVVSGAEVMPDAAGASDASAISNAAVLSDAAEAPAAGTDGDSAEVAAEADIGALKADMDKLGITVTDLRRIGVMNMIMAVIRIVLGFLCVVFSNRVDKSRVVFIAAVALVVCEAAFAVFMYFNRFLSLGTLIYTVFLAGTLLFGAIRMRKIAKADPDRILLMETARSRSAAARADTPKKSIQERAQMGSARDEREEDE